MDNTHKINTISTFNENNKLRLFMDVVGGHSFLLYYTNNLIYKSTSEKEAAFYEFINNITNNSNDDYSDILNLIPKYYGKVDKTNSKLN